MDCSYLLLVYPEANFYRVPAVFCVPAVGDVSKATGVIADGVVSAVAFVHIP
jgi:hypothetical protein